MNLKNEFSIIIDIGGCMTYISMNSSFKSGKLRSTNLAFNYNVIIFLT